MNHTFIKQVNKPEATEYSCFTTLTGLLKSEGLLHLYQTIRYYVIRNNIFQHGNIIIRKVTLTHDKHRK